MTIIGTQRPNGTEIVTVGCPLVESPPTGWDVLREELWVGSLAAVVRGAQRTHEGGVFAVQDVRVSRYMAGRPMLEVTSHGLAGGVKDAKISGTGSVVEDPSLAYETGNIWRATYPRITKLWLSTTVPSIIAHVGVGSVPPLLMGLPNDSWSLLPTITDGIVVAWDADGWMGESRSNDTLPGSTMTLVSDVWVYDPGYQDRD